jgi:hypothetical protein
LDGGCKAGRLSSKREPNADNGTRNGSPSPGPTADKLERPYEERARKLVCAFDENLVSDALGVSPFEFEPDGANVVFELGGINGGFAPGGASCECDGGGVCGSRYDDPGCRYDPSRWDDA